MTDPVSAIDGVNSVSEDRWSEAWKQALQNQEESIASSDKASHERHKEDTDALIKASQE